MMMLTTKEKILNVVVEHIKNQTNLEQLTLSKIAAEANIGKSTVYEHFDSKEEVIIQTYIYLLQEYEIILTAPLVSQDFKSAFIEQLKKILTVMKDGRIIMEALLNQQQSAFVNVHDKIHCYASKIQEKMEGRFEFIFTQAVLEGIVLPTRKDVHEKRVIQAIISGLIYQYVNEDFDITEEGLFTLIYDYVLIVLNHK
jgi:AcrR family transcriptional regulator